VYVLVDGAQSAGQLPLHVQTSRLHFYAVSGQKWLCGPEGTGALYVRRDLLDPVEPSQAGWASVVPESEGMRLEFHPDARRFELATVNVPVFVGMRAAIEFWQRVGTEAVWARIRALSRRARQRLQAVPGLRLFTPSQPERCSGLISFALGELPPEQAVQALWERHRVVSRWLSWPRAVRVSLHAFNTEDEIELLAEALTELVRER
jgi:L-cysteine/cystine lyase